MAMGAENDLDVYIALHEDVYSVSHNDAEGWFHHCNYI
jgi:hypothetical protein